MLNIQALEEIHNDCQLLGKKKNNDYSGVMDPIGAAGIVGIAVRLLDKVARLNSLTRGTEQKVKDESIRDTLMDTINYASYGIMILDGTWDNEN